jgi:hypothetical protein
LRRARGRFFRHLMLFHQKAVGNAQAASQKQAQKVKEFQNYDKCHMTALLIQ